MTRRTYGVSFSVKQCRNFDIEPDKVLQWLIGQGFTRFRLMSYWDECQPTPQTYNWSALDRQLKIIAQSNAHVSLCLGARQPRWPENHWPEWAWAMNPEERSQALLKFVVETVKRYKNHKSIISYQLENEALLGSFGLRSEVDRTRLKTEYKLVKQLDPTKPLIMTTSTAWGIPFNPPVPDIVGFSYYQKFYEPRTGKYHTAGHWPWLDRIRASLIRLFWQKPCFIHELQLEPWGPRNIWEMSQSEQDISMSQEQIAINLKLARQTKLSSIDLWGGEWWYWRAVVLKDPTIINAVKSNLLI